jgi:hypothetical protein
MLLKKGSIGLLRSVINICRRSKHLVWLKYYNIKFRTWIWLIITSLISASSVLWKENKAMNNCSLQISVVVLGIVKLCILIVWDFGWIKILRKRRLSLGWHLNGMFIEYHRSKPHECSICKDSLPIRV